MASHFPQRIEVVDLAPPEAPHCELGIVPEIEEGKIATPTARYVREGKRLSGRQRIAEGIVLAIVVAAHCIGFIG
jgi:hypothetical protein